MVLIAPPRTVIPRRYSVVYEDKTIAKDRCFYVPGAAADSWNVVSDTDSIIAVPPQSANHSLRRVLCILTYTTPNVWSNAGSSARQDIGPGRPLRS